MHPQKKDHDEEEKNIKELFLFYYEKEVILEARKALPMRLSTAGDLLKIPGRKETHNRATESLLVRIRENRSPKLYDLSQVKDDQVRMWSQEYRKGESKAPRNRPRSTEDLIMNARAQLPVRVQRSPSVPSSDNKKEPESIKQQQSRSGDTTAGKVREERKEPTFRKLPNQNQNCYTTETYLPSGKYFKKFPDKKFGDYIDQVNISQHCEILRWEHRDDCLHEKTEMAKVIKQEVGVVLLQWKLESSDSVFCDGELKGLKEFVMALKQLHNERVLTCGSAVLTSIKSGMCTRHEFVVGLYNMRIYEKMKIEKCLKHHKLELLPVDSNDRKFEDSSITGLEFEEICFSVCRQGEEKSCSRRITIKYETTFSLVFATLSNWRKHYDLLIGKYNRESLDVVQDLKWDNYKALLEEETIFQFRIEKLWSVHRVSTHVDYVGLLFDHSEDYSERYIDLLYLELYEEVDTRFYGIVRTPTKEPQKKKESKYLNCFVHNCVPTMEEILLPLFDFPALFHKAINEFIYENEEEVQSFLVLSLSNPKMFLKVFTKELYLKVHYEVKVYVEDEKDAAFESLFRKSFQILDMRQRKFRHGFCEFFGFVGFDVGMFSLEAAKILDEKSSIDPEKVDDMKHKTVQEAGKKLPDRTFSKKNILERRTDQAWLRFGSYIMNLEKFSPFLGILPITNYLMRHCSGCGLIDEKGRLAGIGVAANYEAMISNFLSMACCDFVLFFTEISTDQIELLPLLTKMEENFREHLTSNIKEIQRFAQEKLKELLLMKEAYQDYITPPDIDPYYSMKCYTPFPVDKYLHKMYFAGREELFQQRPKPAGIFEGCVFFFDKSIQKEQLRSLDLFVKLCGGEVTSEISNSTHDVSERIRQGYLKPEFVLMCVREGKLLSPAKFQY